MSARLQNAFSMPSACHVKHAALGLLCLVGLLAMAPSWAAPGVMLRDDDLRASAMASAAKIVQVKKGRTVNVLRNFGGWTQIQYGTATGWVRLLSVRHGPAGQIDYGASLGSAQNAATTPHDSGAITATSGLRGLDVNDLRSARYDANQIEKLERLGVAATDAKAFAGRAGLNARSLAYLPDPAARPAQDDALSPLSGY
jgi:hypothetical protein